MKKSFLLITSCLFATTIYSQSNCTPLNTFDSLRTFIKINYAGYQDKVNPSTVAEFERHSTKTRQLIKSTKNNGQYYHIIRNWLKFFKDEHLSMSVNFDTTGGKLQKTISNAEKYPIGKLSLPILEKKPHNEVEGIYYTADSTYKVAVIKNDYGIRKYAGIILSSKAPQWTPGSIKFELIPDGEKRYHVIFYNRFHYPEVGFLNFEKGNTFHLAGWFKSSYEKSIEPAYRYTPLFPEEKVHNIFFKQIDQQTNYLRIGSFSAEKASIIDSIVKANTHLLETRPYLIIDIRGNGGGADIAYRPLKKLMYTQPVTGIGVDLLATPYNIDVSINLIKSVDGIPEIEKKEYIDQYELARKSNTRMFNFFEDIVEESEFTAFPKKIGIIIDQACASTAEQFLLEARQSKKVTLFGTNSMGVLDYSSVRDKEFCMDFWVHYPTTRSRRLDVGQGIDNIGIKPDIKLDFSKNEWFKQVQKIITQ